MKNLQSLLTEKGINVIANDQLFMVRGGNKGKVSVKSTGSKKSFGSKNSGKCKGKGANNGNGNANGNFHFINCY
jgi:hypothetical protein